jgi:hypothetical protein
MELVEEVVLADDKKQFVEDHLALTLVIARQFCFAAPV